MGSYSRRRVRPPDVFVAQLVMAVAGSWPGGQVVRARRTRGHPGARPYRRQGGPGGRARSATASPGNSTMWSPPAQRHRYPVRRGPPGQRPGTPDHRSLTAIEEASRAASPTCGAPPACCAPTARPRWRPSLGWRSWTGLLTASGTRGSRSSHDHRGDLATVPVGVSVSSFRIVQEALTNVVKHAGAAATTVRVARTPAGVELEVRNDAPAAGPRPP